MRSEQMPLPPRQWPSAQSESCRGDRNKHVRWFSEGYFGARLSQVAQYRTAVNTPLFGER